MTRLWRRAVVGCAALAVVGLAVPAAGVATGKPFSLTQRVLAKGEFPGYVPGGVRVVTSPTTWFKGNPFVSVADLRQAGFVAAAVTNLRATHPAYPSSAISTVVEFRGHRGAVTYLLAFASAFLRAPGAKRFAVRRAPTAIGIAHVPGGAGTYDVVFADGRFFYDVTAVTSDSTTRPTPAQVAAAAARLFSRVHG